MVQTATHTSKEGSSSTRGGPVKSKLAHGEVSHESDELTLDARTSVLLFATHFYYTKTTQAMVETCRWTLNRSEKRSCTTVEISSVGPRFPGTAVLLLSAF